MPSLKEIDNLSGKFILRGGSGCGKTTQIATLPGKTLVIFTDPAGKESLKGLNLDGEYEEFLPDSTRIELASMSTDEKKAKQVVNAPMQEPKAYLECKRYIDDMVKAKKWEKFDNIVLDSLTGFMNLLMDRIIWINQRSGSTPSLDDYKPVMQTTFNLVRKLVPIPRRIFILCHEITDKDFETGKIIQHHINVVGNSKDWVTSQVGSALRMVTHGSGDSMQYVMETRPQGYLFKGIKTSIRGLPNLVDMTIRDWNHPQNYGLGQILSRLDKRENDFSDLAFKPGDSNASTQKKAGAGH